MNLPEHLIEQLPSPYVEVLDSVCRGDGDDVIASRLCIDPSAVPSLVRLAAAKLVEASGSPPAARQ